MSIRINLIHTLLLLVALVTVYSLNDDGDELLRQEALSKLPKPLEKMKIKELQKLLDERGVECTACAEKADLVARVREVIHLPEVPFDSPFRKIGLDAEAAGKAGSKPDLEEILSRLKNLPGMENIKVMDKGDIDKMSTAAKSSQEGDSNKEEL